MVTGVVFLRVGEEKFHQELESLTFWRKLGNRSGFIISLSYHWFVISDDLFNQNKFAKN